MSRSSIHSHVLFINADTNCPYYVYFTGVICRKIDVDDSKTFHIIESTPPPEVKRVKIMERLFYDPNNACAPSISSINSMFVYQKI